MDDIKNVTPKPLFTLHFIWWQGEDCMPAHCKSNVKSWRSIHPECQIRVWDETSLTQLVRSHFPMYLDEWTNTSHFIENVDMAKLFILFVCGGVYIDADILCIQKIPRFIKNYDLVLTMMYVDDICQDKYKCWFSKLAGMTTKSFLMLNNGFYAAKPNTDLLWDIITEAMIKRKTVTKRLGRDYYVSSTCGPVFISKYCHQHNLLSRSDVLVLEEDYVEPCNLYHAITKDQKWCKFTSRTFAFHQHNASWMGKGTKSVIWIIYYRKTLAVLIVGILVFAVIILIKLKKVWLKSCTEK